jgi:hypothetical protein
MKALLALLLVLAVLASGCTTPAEEKALEKINFCYDANAYILGATYDPAAKTVNLTIVNSGDATLSFNAALIYSNGSRIDYRYGSDNISAGAIGIFPITDVARNLEGIEIQSSECTGIGDAIPASSIQNYVIQ